MSCKSPQPEQPKLIHTSWKSLFGAATALHSSRYWAHVHCSVLLSPAYQRYEWSAELIYWTQAQAEWHRVMKRNLVNRTSQNRRGRQTPFTADISFSFVLPDLSTGDMNEEMKKSIKRSCRENIKGIKGIQGACWKSIAWHYFNAIQGNMFGGVGETPEHS